MLMLFANYDEIQTKITPFMHLLDQALCIFQPTIDDLAEPEIMYALVQVPLDFVVENSRAVPAKVEPELLDVAFLQYRKHRRVFRAFSDNVSFRQDLFYCLPDLRRCS